MHTALGFHFSHEQHSPSALLQHALLAAEAGFAHGMCSDHFHPWSERQGGAGFAWSWLGAALAQTSMSFGTVCAPGQRYHPAVIAQAAATLAEMYPRRFWFAVGSGEALNEAITGQPWPGKAYRNARLAESADIMRALWAGQTVYRQATVKVSAARLFLSTAEPPPVFGAALTEETARWLGRWADGLITGAGPRRSLRKIIAAFREGGGEGKPIFLQVALSFAGNDEEAAAAAYDQWRHCALSSQQLADLATPGDFDRACASADREQVLSRIRVSSDPHRQIAWLLEDAELGFDRIYLHNVAREHQERFLAACAQYLLPAFEPADARPRAEAADLSRRRAAG
jgi:probable non-F420 flavinoid oxidoreductase